VTSVLTAVWLVLVLLAQAWLPNSIAAQTPEAPLATPPIATDTERAAKSFAFYPADTGFGTFFSPTIASGQSAKLTALLANTGSVDQDLMAYSVNAYTANGGGFEAAEYGTPRTGVATWIGIESETVSLMPGEGVEIGFTVEVPAGTEPGQYIAAMAGEQAETSDVQGTENFLQKTRFVVPVFITVPGDMETGFEIGSTTLSSNPDAIVIDVEIQNTGDVRIRPEGTVDILDEAGNLMLSLPVTMESIYAHESTVLSLGTTGSLKTGPYTIRVNFSDADTGETATFESEPIPFTAQADIVPPTILINSATVSPAPASDNVQFANVEAVIANGGDPVANAQLSLIASVDGTEVERFPISQSLSLPTGDTPITTRYIPATGWTSGTWSFELLLETVEPGGAAVVVGRQAIEGTITIP